jgi:lipid II:glycine glycyltransferase (peptidoglycan interpeptide bridge formation enzyme)
MFEVFSRAKGHRPELWAATDGSDCPLALLLPIKVTLMGGLLRPVSTRAVAYGSVLCAPGPGGKQALSTLLETYNREQRGALFTELRNLSDLGSLQPLLEENGFIYEDHLNYLVDLDRPADMVLQNMGRRTRKQIRRALRQAAVAIEEASQHDQVQICYRLLQKSYDAAQVPLADYSLFEATFDVLHARGMVKFLLARLEDEYIAGSVELIYKDTIYGWYGGMDRAYGEYIPNELLLWDIFKWGAGNGYRVYDFGGAGKPDEEYGVRKFKAKFGGWVTISSVASYNATFNPAVCIPLLEGEWCFARKKTNGEIRCNPLDGWPN